jgi:hypothetical protein
MAILNIEQARSSNVKREYLTKKWKNYTKKSCKVPIATKL